MFLRRACFEPNRDFDWNDDFNQEKKWDENKVIGIANMEHPKIFYVALTETYVRLEKA